MPAARGQIHRNARACKSNEEVLPSGLSLSLSLSASVLLTVSVCLRLSL